MSDPRLCCNCLHCARWRKKDGIECHCDLNDKYLGYLTVMDEENDCKHWEKETKWDLKREHDKQIKADAIDEFAIWLKEKGIHGSKEFTRIIRMYEDELKEQNND